MPRPIRRRKVLDLPETSAFVPTVQESLGHFPNYLKIILTVDEYETIRLIDYMGLNQEECSNRMEVARTTVQKIYNSAREKISMALVESRPLVISGGSFEIADYHVDSLNHYEIERKENMIIAVATEGTQVCEHFGHAPSFTFYTVEDNKVISKEVLQAPEHAHGVIPAFVAEHNANVIIAGGMGGGAVNLFTKHGIQAVRGASGETDAAVASFLNGTLANSNETCAGHGEHEGEGHGENCDHHHN